MNYNRLTIKELLDVAVMDARTPLEEALFAACCELDDEVRKLELEMEDVAYP